MNISIENRISKVVRDWSLTFGFVPKADQFALETRVRNLVEELLNENRVKLEKRLKEDRTISKG